MAENDHEIPFIARLISGAIGLLLISGPWVLGDHHPNIFSIAVLWYFGVPIFLSSFDSLPWENKAVSKTNSTKTYKSGRERGRSRAKSSNKTRYTNNWTSAARPSAEPRENLSPVVPAALNHTFKTSHSPVIALQSANAGDALIINHGSFNPKDLSEALDLIAQKQQDRSLVPGLVEARINTEKIAMEIAIEYEEECGFTVEDVSAKNIGYDLHSVRGDEAKRIEVKGLSGSGSITLTEHEVSIAKTFPDTYLIYVVENCSADTGKQLHIIRNCDFDKLQPQTVDYSMSLEEQNQHASFSPLTQP